MEFHRIWLAAGVSAFALGTTHHAIAQETVLDRVVITAGEEKVAIETPQAVSSVNQEDIDREQATTVGEVLDDLPGVKSIGSDRVMGESFNIRGIGAGAAADEPRLIVNIDGATKYYEQYRMGSFFSDPELYKRIEVLRGPASSTLYGAGALGGVINLTTKDASDFLAPGETVTLREKMQYANNGHEFLNSTTVAAQPSDRMELLASGNYRTSRTQKDGSGIDIDGSDYNSISGLVKGRFTAGREDEHALTLSFQRWKSQQDDQPYSQTGLGGGAFIGFGTIDRKVEDDTLVGTYEYDPIDNPWIDTTVRGSYTNSENHQSDVSPGLRFAFGDTWEVAYKIKQFSVENTSTFRGEDWDNFLTVGVQTAFQNRESAATLFGGPFFPGSHPAGESDTFGVFAQSEFVYDNWLTVIPGVRFDEVRLSADSSVSAAVLDREHEFSLFSPKIAAHAKISDTLGVFGSVAHTERAPVLDELYDTDGQRNIKPEKSDNFEVGTALSFRGVAEETDALQVKTTGFYNLVDDLIFRGTDGQPYLNAPGAMYYGFEVEGGYESEYVFGRLAYSLIRGRLKDSDDLDSIPADELAITLGGRIPSHDIEFGWRGVFAADQDRVSNPASTAEGNGAPTSGYVVQNLFASWMPESGTFENFGLRFGVENLFDKEYREHLSGDNARGRTFKLTATGKF